MVLLTPYEYPRITQFTDELCSEKVYPLSIIEGTQQGEIFADSTMNARSVLFWHRCGFAWLAGMFSEKVAESIREMMFSPTEWHSGRLVLLANDDERLDSLLMRYGDIKKSFRYIFEYTGENVTAGKVPQCGGEPVRITAENYDSIEGRIVPSFSWSCAEDFLEKGFGYCLNVDGEFAACAFTSGISREYADIGVETSPKFRGKGCARAVTRALIEDIISRGMTPVWGCSTENEGSKRLAVSSGFVIKGEHPVYYV